jgi:hypothetical protein
MSFSRTLHSYIDRGALETTTAGMDAGWELLF